jgi:predicted metal-binding membrane protein
VVASEYAPTKAAGLERVPLLALGAAAAAWVVLFTATMNDAGGRLYSSSMSAATGVASKLEFLGAWELMVVAMMLPSSSSFFALLRVVTGGGRLAIVSRALAGAGYSLVWAAAGCVAMALSPTIYRIGAVHFWLDAHASVFAGSVLVLAGAFQFTTPKHRCLAVCGNPGGFLMRHYRRGAGGAMTLGLRYGLACVGCCWALMVAMVVLGGGSLFVMMILALIMFAERAMGWTGRFAGAVGLVFIGLGVLVAASPDTMPAFAQNAANWVDMASMQAGHHSMLFWCHA